MKLLDENELIWSWVVNNSKMNREPNASAVNSYEKELKFRPEEFLEKHIQQYFHVKALANLISLLPIKAPMMKWGQTIPDRMRCARYMKFCNPIMPTAFLLLYA